MCSSPTSVSEGLDLSSLIFALPLGAAVAHDTPELMRRHFPSFKFIFNLYGQGEVGNMISFSLTPKHIGYIYPGTEVKIVDPDTGETLGPNKIGEILAKTDCLMKGYYNRPEENAKFFGKDGFAHTGDLGHYDEDGILYFDSRMKETIKYQNVHIHPLEVEEVMYGHPAVEEVGVFGMTHPEDQEHVAAAVVLKKGHSATEEEMKKLVESHLEKPKWLRGGVRFVEGLPHNSTGKLQRKQLQALYDKK